MRKIFLILLACAFSFTNGWAQNKVGGASCFHQINRKPRVSNPVQCKTVQNTMQRLDSVESYANDPINGITTLNYKEGYWYNQNNRCIGYYSLQLNDLSQTMDSSYKELYAFDVNGRILEITTFMFDGTMFSYDTKVNNTYDVTGNLVQVLEESWDITTNGWINNVLTSSTFDANGNMTQEITSFWDATVQQWVNGFRVTNSYNNGLITFSLNENYDVTQNTWVGNAQTIYTYDTSGLLLSEEGQYFDAATFSWMSSTLTEYTYNASGQPDIMISSYFDSSTGSYTPSFQTNFLYDAQGNRIQELSFDPADPFNPLDRQNFTFDNTYAFADLILPNYLVEEVPDYFTHKLMELSMDMWDGAQWQNQSTAFLYYSTQSVGVNENHQIGPVVLYPNPAQNQMMIKGMERNQMAYLFNASGQCIAKQMIQGNSQMEIGHLPSGIYAWVINGKTYSFIKE